MATQKTTSEIRALLINADIDFESVENRVLNDYLPKIFHSCPFTEEPCTTKQCVECDVFKNCENNQDSKAKRTP
jgi:hypothetical protein